MIKSYLSRRVASALAFSLLSWAATAEQADDLIGWGGQGEFGFSLTDGNTDTQNLNTKLALEKKYAFWENILTLEANNKASNDITDAEKYFAGFQLNRNLTETDFLFGHLSYADDRFSGFEFESTLSLGYGRRLINTDRTSLDFEVGPGYRVSRIKGFSSEDEAVLRTALKLAFGVSENALFTQDFTVDAGEERVISKSVTALTSQVLGKLAMKFSISVKNNSEPPVGNEKTDTETAVTLVYGF